MGVNVVALGATITFAVGVVFLIASIMAWGIVYPATGHVADVEAWIALPLIGTAMIWLAMQQHNVASSVQHWTLALMETHK